jgi:organic radical activating enzyme
MKITIEVTNFCPNHCKYCSSNTVDSFSNALFLPVETILEKIKRIQAERDIVKFDQIILSGGEPLSHPNIYQIITLLHYYTDDIVLYSNLITHICFNGNVIDNIYVEENLTVSPDVNKIHILKRVEQGREKRRPEVVFSKNFTENCNCGELVIRPNGIIDKSPCNKTE